MPVVIRNLIIEAEITEGHSSPQAGAEQGEVKTSGGINEDIKNRIIEEAVNQVLEILERQKDR
jgi:hypothetical protein